jgi:hypothetical protein
VFSPCGTPAKAGLASVALSLLILCVPSVDAVTVSLTWQPSSSTNVAGYLLYYGTVSGEYPLSVNAGTNTTCKVSELIPGQTYYYVVTAYDSFGQQSADSNEVTNTAPLLEIVTQPMPMAVEAGSVAVLSVNVFSVMPVTYQWFFDGTAIDGATNSVLVLPQASEGNSGRYQVVASNSAGTVASQIVPVNVLSSVPGFTTAELVPPIGSYSGLFYQTDLSGNSLVTEASTGLLSKCTIGPFGVYSSQVSVGGQTFAISGICADGKINTVVNRTSLGLPNLSLILYANAALNTHHLTGVVSNMSSTDSWVSLVTAALNTNGWAPESLFFMSPPPAGQPLQYWFVELSVKNGTASLTGQLGDGTTISQASPIGVDGSFPVYQNLYNRTGLLAGYVTLAAGNPVGNLTWLCPGDPYQGTVGFTNIISFGTGPGLSTNCFQIIRPIQIVTGSTSTGSP